MKHNSLVIGWCLCVAAWMAPLSVSAFGDLNAPPSDSRQEKPKIVTGLKGKRIMDEAALAMSKWKQAQAEKATGPEMVSKPLTAETLPAFFDKYLKNLYALDPSNQLIQIAQWDGQGNIKKLRSVPKGSKRVNAERFLAHTYDGMTFTVPQKSERPCSFCDGKRYVIYFPEEIRAARDYQKRNHASHDTYNVRGGTFDLASGSAGSDRRSLEERAPIYGWNSAWSMTYGIRACCWTRMHESGLNTYRHHCPICKGKEKEIVVKLYTYQLSLPGRPMPVETPDTL